MPILYTSSGGCVSPKGPTWEQSLKFTNRSHMWHPLESAYRPRTEFMLQLKIDSFVLFRNMSAIEKRLTHSVEC